LEVTVFKLPDCYHTVILPGLPAKGSRGALEGTRYSGGNPTAIEIAVLSLNYFAVDKALIHSARVESYVVE